MSCSLNSSMKVISGSTIGGIKRDTRSSDNSSHVRSWCETGCNSRFIGLGLSFHHLLLVRAADFRSTSASTSHSRRHAFASMGT